MRCARKILLLAVGLGLVPLTAAAQSIDDLSWIAGTWATDLPDQVLEERWSPPMANAMTGSFRWARDGEVWLYEFLLMEQTEDGIFYYLRHFGPGSLGWEERDQPLAYQLATLEPNRAVFNALGIEGNSFVFERVDDQLTIQIVSGDDVKNFVYSLQDGDTGVEAGETTVDEPDPASTDAGADGAADEPAADADQE